LFSKDNNESLLELGDKMLDLKSILNNQLQPENADREAAQEVKTTEILVGLNL
jgi:hypothetical protein